MGCREWINFSINRPKRVLVIVLVLTIAALSGYPKLFVNFSSRTLIPVDSAASLAEEKVRKVFGDTTSYLVTSIEPSEGGKLLSRAVFFHINNLVMEIEEFGNFNSDRENRRLESLLLLGNITIQEKGRVRNRNRQEPEKISSDMTGMKPEPDTGEDAAGTDRKFNDGGFLKGSGALVNKLYPMPRRERNVYLYKRYLPVKLISLKEKLDSSGINQLETILWIHGIDSIKSDRPLSLEDYMKIVETWEDVYLYKSMEAVRYFLNPISGHDIRIARDGLKRVELVPTDRHGMRVLPESNGDFKNYYKRIQANPAFESLLFIKNNDGSIRAFSLSMALKPLNNPDQLTDYISAMIRKYDRAPVILASSGFPVYAAFVKSSFYSGFVLFMPLVLLVIFFTHYMFYGHGRGALLSVLPSFFGVVWTMGLAGHAGVPVNIFYGALPLLIVTAGTFYAFHMYHGFFINRKGMAGEEKKIRLLSVMEEQSRSVYRSALIVSGGFTALLASRVESIRYLGLFMAAGVLFAMSAVLLIIPSLLVLMDTGNLRVKAAGSGVRYKAGHKGTVAGTASKIIDRIIHFSLTRSGRAVVLAMFVAGVCFIGLMGLTVGTGPMFRFKENSPFCKSDLGAALFRGTILSTLIIDSGKNGGVKAPAFINYIEEIRALIGKTGKDQHNGSVQTFALGDYFKRLYMAENGEKREYYAIPGDDAIKKDYVDRFSGDDDYIRWLTGGPMGFTDRDWRYATVSVGMGMVSPSGKSAHHGTISGTERIEEILDRHPESRNYRHSAAGEVHMLRVLTGHGIHDQVLYLMLTVLIMVPVLLSFFKNWYGSFITAVPILSSVLAVYGALGLAGASIDPAMVFFCPVIVCAGTFCTVNMAGSCRHALGKALSMADMIRSVREEAGMVTVSASLALASGFMIFIFNDFFSLCSLPWYMVLTMSAVAAATLMVLPAVIFYFAVPFER